MRSDGLDAVLIIYLFFSFLPFMPSIEKILLKLWHIWSDCTNGYRKPYCMVTMVNRSRLNVTLENHAWDTLYPQSQVNNSESKGITHDLRKWCAAVKQQTIDRSPAQAGRLSWTAFVCRYCSRIEAAHISLVSICGYVILENKTTVDNIAAFSHTYLEGIMVMNILIRMLLWSNF